MADPIESDDLDALGRIMMEFMDLFRLQNEAVRENTHTLLSYSRFSRHGLMTSLRDTNILIANLIKELMSSIEQAERGQKQALSLGRNLTDAFGVNTEQLKKLPGGIGDAIDIRLSQLEMGLTQYNDNLTKLAVQQRLTGQDFTRTLQIFRNLEILGGMTLESQSTLSNHLLELTRQYGVSTDRLVDAIEGLASRFIEFRALGISEDMTTAVTELTAQLGAQTGPLLARAVDFLTGTDMSNMVRASLLGLQGFRSTLSQPGVDTEVLRNAIIEGGERMSSLVRQFTEGTPDPATQLGILQNIFGREALLLMTLSEEMKKVSEQDLQMLEARREFNESWEAVKGEIFEPIRLSILKLTSSFLSFLPIIKNELTTIGFTLAGIFALNRFVSATSWSALFGFLGRMEFSLNAMVATGAGGLLGTLQKVALTFSRFIGPIGILISLASIAVKFFRRQEAKDFREESRKSIEAAEQRLRDQKQTNRFLELHSNTLKSTLDGITMMSQLQDKLSTINQDQLNALITIAGEMRAANINLQDMVGRPAVIGQR